MFNSLDLKNVRGQPACFPITTTFTKTFIAMDLEKAFHMKGGLGDNSYANNSSLQVPPGIYDEQGVSINKKSIYISERSPSGVAEAFLRQFQEDWSFFLKSRSEEIVSGGKMVLLLLGRTGPYHVDRNSSIYWEMLYQSLATLVTQKRKSWEGYEMNFYAPSKEELEEEVRKEGSFKVEMIEKFEQGIDIGSGGNRYSSYGQAVAKTVRSIQESMIAHHFGEGVLDKLFHQYAGVADREMAKHGLGSTHIVLLLTRL
ncbi:UNVERIFIED_CONTAM: Jasmonate O-methyltransferase [Sesamum angustifolium]|uniref:Jasmonate O-methyltransferase n=1 Tax=Sesamum angustifolium TaxID=2727405 RepID=A0AAW2NNY4_9LAMI